VRILYIDHYAGSIELGMEYRPWYLAREWVAMGHEVTIVGASHSHLRRKQPLVSADTTREDVSGVQFLWLKTPAYHGNGLGRIGNMTAFIRQLYRQKRPLVGWKPDIVIASSTYTWDIYPARSIACAAQAKLIYEVHDLWPMSPMELGPMPRWHPFIIALQHGEDYACRHADIVVSILPHADRHLLTRGLRPARYFHVPNGVDLDEWSAVATTEGLAPVRHAQDLRRRGGFALGYVGGHGPSNALDSLLDVADRLRNTRVEFLLIGDGSLKAQLRESAAARNLSNVHFFDPVPKVDVPQLLRSCDALYFGMKPSPLYRFGICPNKLFDYMMSGRPIVQAHTASNDIVAEAGCGVTADPRDAGAIAEAIRTLETMPPESRDRMGAQGVAYVRNAHDYRTLASRFADIVDHPLTEAR
jgi:glycosyltransferase involved in cell wall biosynthesis